MTNLSRRGFMAGTAAALSVRAVPQIGAQVLRRTGGKRILTLAYDKSLGMMRAIDRLVP